MRTSAAAVGLLVFAGAAVATPVTLSYSGTVDRVSYADCTSLNNSGSCTAWTNTNVASSDFVNGNLISVGSSFSGSFTYDTDTPLGPFGMSSDGRQATYLDAGLSASLQVGMASLPASPWLPFASTGGSVAVIDNRYGWDSLYLSRSYSGPALFASSHLSLFNYSGTLFDSFAMPPSIPASSINGSVFNVGFLRRSDGDQLQVFGTISGFSFSSAVPEPPPAVLATLGGMMVALCGRRAGSPRPFVGRLPQGH
jgi:hypothetical protein